MMAGRPDGAQVVIVGGGVEGLATAWALTCRGVRDVLVLERDSLAGAATAKSSGVVRCHYGVPSLAAMAWQGLQILESAADVLGADVGFHRTGYVVAVGGADVDALTANVALGRRLGIDVDLVDAETVAELWPGMRLEDFAAFAYEPRGGYGDGAQTALAFAAAARRGGARVRQQAPVAAIETDRVGRVRGVRLADGEQIGAATVVVAAGWVDRPAAGSAGARRSDQGPARGDPAGGRGHGHASGAGLQRPGGVAVPAGGTLRPAAGRQQRPSLPGLGGSG